ncbi:MAG: ABC transporter permease [Solimonas sp.]
MKHRAFTGLLALCIKELRLLSCDLHGLAVLFAVPILFILLLSLALRDAFDPSAVTRVEMQLIDDDHGALARHLLAALREQPGVTISATATTRVTIPAGFSELLATRHEFADDYLRGEPEPPLLRIDYAASVMPQTRAVLALTVRGALLQVQSDYLFREVLGEAGAQLRQLRYLGDPRRVPVVEAFRSASGAALRAPTAVQQNVPGWLIFAMFFAVIPLATSFVVERSQGSLLRLRVLGVPPATLLLAKALPYYLVNLLQMLAMLAVGIWLVPLLGGDRLDPGHSIAGLWLIGSATSLAAIALALCVAVSVRTSLQATIAGGAISLLLAALGGIMVPKLLMPATMQTLTNLSPMAWALDGYSRLLVSGGGVRDVLPQSAALFVFATLALLLAAGLYRHTSFSHPG